MSMAELKNQTHRRQRRRLPFHNSLPRKAPQFRQTFAQFNSLALVHSQHVHRGSADRGLADEQIAVPAKMMLPEMTPRIEQSGQLACERIKARQIRRLVEIASMARQCEIGGPRRPMVFEADNVFDVMRRHRRIDFGQPAVFTTEISAAANEAPELLIHDAFRAFINAFRAFACRIEMKSIART